MVPLSGEFGLRIVPSVGLDLVTAGVTRPLFPFLRKVRCLGIVKVSARSGQQVDERKLCLVKMWCKKEQMLVSVCGGCWRKKELEGQQVADGLVRRLAWVKGK